MVHEALYKALKQLQIYNINLNNFLMCLMVYRAYCYPVSNKINMMAENKSDKQKEERTAVYS